MLDEELTSIVPHGVRPSSMQTLFVTKTPPIGPALLPMK